MNETTPFPSLAVPAAPVPAPASRRWIGGACAGLLLALSAWWGVSCYNQLQRSDVYLDYAWHQAINQYTRRSELVPNLVAVVKSYAVQETELFRQIAATRSSLAAIGTAAPGDARRVEQFQAAQGQLAGQLSRLLIVAEKYPELKASSLYQDLMAQLEGTENRIAFARQQYLEAVADYNLNIRSFPGSLIAAQAGMKPRQAGAFADETRVRLPLVVELK
jgi:LemA protein